MALPYLTLIPNKRLVEKVQIRGENTFTEPKVVENGAFWNGKIFEIKNQKIKSNSTAQNLVEKVAPGANT